MRKSTPRLFCPRSTAEIRDLPTIGTYMYTFEQHRAIGAKITAMRETLDIYISEMELYAGITVPGADPIAVEQFTRRTAIRMIYSMIEAMSYLMKQIALSADDPPYSLFSAPERAILAEETYELDPNGIASIKPARLSTLANVRFSFQVLSRVVSLPYTLDVSQHGWQQVREGIKIRDRLTHPKQASDLTVSEDEILLVVTAYKWFIQCMAECQIQVMKALMSQW